MSQSSTSDLRSDGGPDEITSDAAAQPKTQEEGWKGLWREQEEDGEGYKKL